MALIAGSGAACGAPAADCPDVSGLYLIDGTNDFGTPLRDAVGALQVSRARRGGGGGHVQLSRLPSGDIGVSWTDGHAASQALPPDYLLSRGGDFQCRQGQVVFNQRVSTFRTIDGRTHRGEARIRMAPAEGGLRFVFEFSGTERVSLYSYDSANVSVPRPFSRRSVTEELLWPRTTASESYRPMASATTAASASAGEDTSRPSPARVQQELERMRYSLAHVTQVEATAEGYVATVNLLDNATSEHAIARLKANTAMFSRVEVLGERPDATYPKIRVAKWRLTLARP